MKLSPFRWVLLTTCCVLVSSCGTLQPEKIGQVAGKEYQITLVNKLPDERFAPVLIVGDADDSKIWVGSYVSAEARTQFTTGNPAPLAGKLGGDQGFPGKVDVRGQITFVFKTSATKARILAMVHPDITPDNYVSALIDLRSDGQIELQRFDIGDNEKRFTVQAVGTAGLVTWKAK